jgi:hypothetical protein
MRRNTTQEERNGKTGQKKIKGKIRGLHKGKAECTGEKG